MIKLPSTVASMGRIAAAISSSTWAASSITASLTAAKPRTDEWFRSAECDQLQQRIVNLSRTANSRGTLTVDV